MTKQAPMLRIVGAGVSGLSLAYFLRKKNVAVEIIDEQPRPGGMLQSQWVENFGLAEPAANAFLNSDLLESIAEDIKIDLLPTQKSARKRLFFTEQKMTRWPLNTWETLVVFFRLLCFMFSGTRKKIEASETVLHWSHRNLGKDFTYKILSTALQGIYGGDVSSLSARLVFGRFLGIKVLSKLGPFTRAKKAVKIKGSVSFAGGMQDFSARLFEHLSNAGVIFQMKSKVDSAKIKKFATEGPLVVATSLSQAAALLSDQAGDFSNKAKSLPLNKLSSGTLFFAETSRVPQAFGVLVAREEKLKTLGVLFNHNIFAGRVSDPQWRSETWIINDALPEKEFLRTVQKERPAILGLNDAPQAFKIKAWSPAFPLYSLDLENFLSAHPELPRLTPGLYVHGNYLGRIGLTQILEQSYEMAEMIYKDIYQ